MNSVISSFFNKHALFFDVVDNSSIPSSDLTVSTVSEKFFCIILAILSI